MSPFRVFGYLFVGSLIVIGAAMAVVVLFFALAWLWKRLW